MTVLVTGGAGFIGRHVARALRDAGFKVRIFDNFSNAAETGLEEVADEVVRGDVRDMNGVQAAMEGVTDVVHLAALVSVPVSLSQPERTFADNVVGTENMLAAAREAALPGRLVFASSAAVYGTVAAETYDESMAEGAVHLSPYAATKAMNEVQARMYGSCYGLRTLGLRFFNVYGPGQDPKSPYSGVLARLLDVLENGGTFTVYGDGSRSRDYVAVEDLAAAIAGLLRLPKTAELPPVMNVGTGDATDLNALVETVGEVLGRPVPMVYGPPREGDQERSCARIAKLQAALPGWRPSGLRDGLTRWLRPV